MEIQWGENEKVTFSMKELLVPSEHRDTQEEGACYIGIFPNTNAKSLNTLYLGQLFMKKYYTYFDISGVQENGTNFLRIGTGLKNPNTQILQ